MALLCSRIRPEDRKCPLSAALGHVGAWWTLLILHDVFDGYRRFDQFQENLGISSSMLTARLKALVAGGLLGLRAYQDNPACYEYLLTDLGRSLRPVLIALAAWGSSRPTPAERSMILVDARPASRWTLR
jgi:DNA-binding HxlR family transcriptional regulator